MKTLFTHGQVHTHNAVLKEAWLLVQDDRISSYGTSSNTPNADRVISLENKALLPGFINIHVHGALGADTMDGDPKSIEKMSRFEAAHGVTALLPTTMTASKEATLSAISAVQTAMDKRTGARVLGVHLEGPFLSANKAGAQATEHMRCPSPLEYQTLFETNCVKLITIAPELDGAIDLIRYACSQDITVAAGHSIATFAQMQNAVAAGLGHVTHLFNGMPGFHHRQPGIVGAALTQDTLSVEVIADLIHLHPAALSIALESKPDSKLVLITDAMRAAGMPDGIYDLGGQEVHVTEGQARLADGTLAGSTLALDKAINNMIKALALPLEDAVRLASINPAKVIGIQDHKGEIAPGMDADLVVWNQGTVELTMVEGQVVYKSPGL